MRRFAILLVAVSCFAAPVSAKEPKYDTGKVHELTTKHERSWWLYVPSSYSKKKSWPLVISSHGANGSGKGEIKPWRNLATQHGFIVACPDMVAATTHRPKTSSLSPSDEDDEVIMAIYDWIAERYRVNPRAAMITGFSGGGYPSYYTGLRHPDRFTHICTRGGNFHPNHVPRDDTVLDAGRTKLQIYIFYGDKDHPLILGKDGNPGEARQAHTALTETGYEHVTIEEVEGMGHQSRPQRAAAWFAEYVKANGRMFKYGDEVDGLIAKALEARAKGKTGDAVKRLLKARAIEEKRELESLTKPHLDALQAEGSAKLDEAKALKDTDLSTALKALVKIARDYKGLPAADDAKALQKAWKK